MVKIVVLGAGSIGSLFGGYLASLKLGAFDVEVYFACRRAHADAINEGCLQIEVGERIIEVDGIQAFFRSSDLLEIASSWEEDSHGNKIDFLILSVKVFDLETILKEYRGLLDASRWVVILQNGIGNEEFVKKYCNASKIIRIITSHGAVLEKPGVVIHTGHGFVKIGSPFLRNVNIDELDMRNGLRLLKELLDSSGLGCEISDDIIHDAWKKVIVNVGINPLGALTRLRNGDLLNDVKLKDLISSLVEEAVVVANAVGLNLDKNECLELTFSVADKTRENLNSMLQDILRGRQTEIEFMNGKIVSLAEELGISVPMNDIIVRLIRGLERSMLKAGGMN